MNRCTARVSVSIRSAKKLVIVKIKKTTRNTTKTKRPEGELVTHTGLPFFRPRQDTENWNTRLDFL